MRPRACTTSEFERAALVFCFRSMTPYINCLTFASSIVTPRAQYSRYGNDGVVQMELDQVNLVHSVASSNSLWRVDL
jgi:hypothetical protein